jgi:apolipoprotein D and lipocalin family protein
MDQHNYSFYPKYYEGTWYEIARYPNWFQTDCVQSEVSYTWSGYDMKIKNICRLVDGSYDTITGRATIPDSRYPHHLLVDFDPGYQGQYWVLWTDYDKWSLVGNNNKTSFWILSRTPTISSTDFDLLISHARTLGYNGQLIITDGAIYNF